MVDNDLVGKLSEGEKNILEFRMNSISPDSGKYGKSSEKLADYLSPRAEWLMCAEIQRQLLETRMEFGQAKEENVKEVVEALKKISPSNISLLEEKVTKHDQLAVIEEIGRYVSPETKALLHPGTTSYDILDTARSKLFKMAWYDVIRPEISKAMDQLCNIAEKSMDYMQIGRTHLQNTSPVLFGGVLAGYAARIAERTEKCDSAFASLKGKISGIVGTGASIDAVIGNEKSIEFEKKVLEALELKPDYTATQIVQKESMADAGHSLTTLMHVLADFANDIRMLYSSAIQEVTSRDNAERLGGSSADAGKNNPIQYENIAGKAAIVESGMRVLYEMIHSDFQRDLRNSVQARYQPQTMMCQVYESFSRLNKALPQLSVNEDIMKANLEPLRKSPTEAMTAILRGKGFIHSKYGVGHDFVREMAKRAKKEGKYLLETAKEDSEFMELHKKLSMKEKNILYGGLEDYLGSAAERARINLEYAKRAI